MSEGDGTDTFDGGDIVFKDGDVAELLFGGEVILIDLFIFSVSPGSVLEGYTFLRICPFIPSCPFYWHRVACSSLLGCFVFLWCVL